MFKSELSGLVVNQSSGLSSSTEPLAWVLREAKERLPFLVVLSLNWCLQFLKEKGHCQSSGTLQMNSDYHLFVKPVQYFGMKENSKMGISMRRRQSPGDM